MSPKKTPDEPIFPKGPEDKLSTDLPLERELETRDPEVDVEASTRQAMQEELETMRHKIDPDYKARNRAKFLRSVKVDKAYSPANRVEINRPKGDPNVYRFNSEELRVKIGMDGWEPVTDFEKAKRICPSSYLRQAADGRIYSGDSFLCTQSEDKIEMRNAAMLQKAERLEQSASSGQVSMGEESFAQMRERTKSSDDPVGIRMSGRLSEDSPSE